MTKSTPRSISEIFAEVQDPRSTKNRLHLLVDILVLAFCGILAGAEGFTDFEQFGKHKKKWFKTFLKLPNGIPSHDTFGKVFAVLNPKVLHQCFMEWLSEVRSLAEQQGISIDGKKLRGSQEKKKKSAVTILSAYAYQAGLVLGQVKVEEGSNEIEAIPELLKLLQLKGCLVSIDAIGCQKEIVKQIREQEGDYLIPVKENQPKLYKSIQNSFLEMSETNFRGHRIKVCESREKNRGRKEYRKCWITENVSRIPEEIRKEWKDLTAIAMVYRRREEGEKVSEEESYYITSLKADALNFAKHLRRHWSIENELHWRLDVIFREDQCRVREDNAAANLSVLRQLGINLLKKEKSDKASIRSKFKRCAWDDYYLSKLLSL
jgi:predicted transposase YbfD/YdcC